MSGASRGRSSFAEMIFRPLTKVFSDLEISSTSGNSGIY